MKTTSLCLLGALILGATTTAFGQNAEKSAFDQLAAQNVAPSQVLIKDLTKNWRRVIVERDDDNTMAGIYGMGRRNVVFQQKLAEMGLGVYYTKGQTVSLGTETFLIAYRIQNEMTPNELNAMFRNMYGGHGENAPPPGPQKWAPNTPLRLALLNLRTTGSLTDLRPFDPEREIMGPRDVTAASDRNLEQLGRYLTQLIQNQRQNRGYPPELPLRNIADARNIFTRYFHAPTTIYAHPQSKETYRTNAALTKKKAKNLMNSAQLVAFYEAKPGTDLKRGATFLDGRVERIPEWKWKSVISRQPQLPSEGDYQKMSLENLQKLATQLRRYVRVSGGKLPVMTNAGTTRQALSRSLGIYNASFFNHPKTGQAYRPNAALSGLKWSAIRNPAQLVAFYEVGLGNDGKRAAVFLDGHTAQVPEADWKGIKAVKVVTSPNKKA